MGALLVGDVHHPARGVSRAELCRLGSCDAIARLVGATDIGALTRHPTWNKVGNSFDLSGGSARLGEHFPAPSSSPPALSVPCPLHQRPKQDRYVCVGTVTVRGGKPSMLLALHIHVANQTAPIRSKKPIWLPCIVHTTPRGLSACYIYLTRAVYTPYAASVHVSFLPWRRRVL